LQEVSEQLSSFFFINVPRCLVTDRECARVREGRAKSCLVCSKAKHRCLGAVWGNGEGNSGEVVGVPSGSVSEELREMRGIMKDMMRLQKASIKAAAENLEEVTWVLEEVLDSIQYRRDNERDAELFDEWVSGMKFGEMGNEVAELQAEEADYREWLKERAEKREVAGSVGEEVATEVVVEESTEM
jgi:hypothetical protein